MEDKKIWWQSRTIWAGIVGAIFSFLSLLGKVPDGLTAAMIVDAIVGTTSVLAIIFRAKADKIIEPILPTISGSEDS
jgi:hypothetical protein